MTYICDLNDCAYCNDAACRACDAKGDTRSDKSPRCRHDPIERHCANLPIDDEEEPAQCRVPTKPLEGPLLAGKITIDLSDADQVAAFLRHIARIIEAKGKISITVE